MEKIKSNTTNTINTSNINQPILDDMSIDSDPIINYDLSKLYDPLQNPTRRVPRHELPNFYFRNMIDIPTRGYPDNFSLYGILIKDGHKKGDIENSLLKLFGRQTYPGSNTYEYYALVNSGLDQIKLEISNNRSNFELSDGDIVFLPELNSNYRVKLNKYDAPRYYPDLF